MTCAKAPTKRSGGYFPQSITSGVLARLSPSQGSPSGEGLIRTIRSESQAVPPAGSLTSYHTRFEPCARPNTGNCCPDVAVPTDGKSSPGPDCRLAILAETVAVTPVPCCALKTRGDALTMTRITNRIRVRDHRTEIGILNLQVNHKGLQSSIGGLLTATS